MELEIFETIRNAFGASTHSNNLFKKALDSIKWEDKFEADGEYYFCIGNLIFTTPSLDPFKVTKSWEACGQFSDGSQIYFH